MELKELNKIFKENLTLEDIERAKNIAIEQQDPTRGLYYGVPVIESAYKDIEQLKNQRELIRLSRKH